MIAFPAAAGWLDDAGLIDAGLDHARRIAAWDTTIRLAAAAPHHGADLLAIERAAFPWLPEPSGRTLAAFDCSRPFATPLGPLLRVVAQVDGPIAGYVFVQPRATELFVWDMAHRTAACGPGGMAFGSLLMLVCVGIAIAARLPQLRFDVTRRDGRQAASLRLCARHGLSVSADSAQMIDGSPAHDRTIWLTGQTADIAARLEAIGSKAHGQGR